MHSAKFHYGVDFLFPSSRIVITQSYEKDPSTIGKIRRIRIRLFGCCPPLSV